MIGVTVITALFPGMSRSGADGDDPAVAHTLSPRAVAGRSGAGAGHVGVGDTWQADRGLRAATRPHHARQAHLTGQVLIAFAIGLVPFSAFQMQLRAWLAVRDSRTPALVNVWAPGSTSFSTSRCTSYCRLTQGRRPGARLLTVLRRRCSDLHGQAPPSTRRDRAHPCDPHPCPAAARRPDRCHPAGCLITHLIGPEYQSRPAERWSPPSSRRR